MMKIAQSKNNNNVKDVRYFGLKCFKLLRRL